MRSLIHAYIYHEGMLVCRLWRKLVRRQLQPKTTTPDNLVQYALAALTPLVVYACKERLSFLAVWNPDKPTRAPYSDFINTLGDT
jgi:hypothetical protein